MNTDVSSSSLYDLQPLMQAINSSSAEDALKNPFNPDQWTAFAGYVQPCHLTAGQILFGQGLHDRTLYLVESGSLSVHYEDAKSRVRLAIVGPGSSLGEGGFFSGRARSATVQASTPCKLWALSALRFTEMTNRQPAMALAIAMAAGAVLAKRLGNRRRRIAAT